MLQGTDLDWFRRLRAATGREITAAGGITTLDDVRALPQDERELGAGDGDLHGPSGLGRTRGDVTGGPLNLRGYGQDYGFRTFTT